MTTPAMPRFDQNGIGLARVVEQLVIAEHYRPGHGPQLEPVPVEVCSVESCVVGRRFPHREDLGLTRFADLQLFRACNETNGRRDLSTMGGDPHMSQYPQPDPNQPYYNQPDPTSPLPPSEGGGHPTPAYVPQPTFAPQQPQQPAMPPQYGYQPPPPEPRNAFGITALVLAIVGCVFMLIPLTGFIATICGLLAILFALLNRGRLKRRTATNKKTTIVAAILGALATVVGIIGMVIVFSAVDDLDNDLTCIDEAKTAKQLDQCN